MTRKVQGAIRPQQAVKPHNNQFCLSTNHVQYEIKATTTFRHYLLVPREMTTFLNKVFLARAAFGFIP